jgi:hypothetical protein
MTDVKIGIIVGSTRSGRTSTTTPRRGLQPSVGTTVSSLSPTSTTIRRPGCSKAIDYLYAEWNNRPVAFVSYGSLGGAR